MFNPSREGSREFLYDAWGKYRHKEVLTDMENRAVRVILAHPEYQPILSEPENYKDRDYLPEADETNPFLHLNLHMTIEEQLSINQPKGIRLHYQRLTEIFNSEHEASHAIMECLAEIIWQALHNKNPYDDASYLSCLAKQGSKHRK